MQDVSEISPAEPASTPKTVDLRAEYESSGVREVLDELDRELIGLAPVKARIRETAALLLVVDCCSFSASAHRSSTDPLLSSGGVFISLIWAVPRSANSKSG